MDIIEITLKLLLAIALGGLIGLERETSQKPAGFRTNILICVGSAMMMILADLLLKSEGGSGGDLTRIAAGVITGIGFIGAGTIIQSRGIVVGLTTAATLWAVAGLGLVIGAGYYLPAVVFCSILLLTLIIFRRFENVGFRASSFRYFIKASASKDVFVDIKRLAIHEGIKFDAITQRKEDKITFINFAFTTDDDKEQKFSLGLVNIDGILEIKNE